MFKRRLATLTAAIVLGGGLAVAVDASAAPAVSVAPSSGHPSTTFKVIFAATYPEHFMARTAQFYYYEGKGPRGACHDFGAGVQTAPYSAGKVSMDMTPDSIGDGNRSAWCPGGYHGRVLWRQTNRHGVVTKEHSIGRFHFTVKRPHRH